jgi:hypothetical protein
MIMMFNDAFKPDITTDLPQVTDKLYHIMLYRVHLAWVGFELTTLTGTDCIGNCKSNYHTITTMTTPKFIFAALNMNRLINSSAYSLFNFIRIFSMHIHDACRQYICLIDQKIFKLCIYTKLKCFILYFNNKWKY